MARIKYMMAEGGSTTYAATASMGLLLWLFRYRSSRPLPKNPECFVLYQVGEPVEGPYNQLFLVHVVACIERKYQASPNVPEELLSPDWYNNLPKIGANHEYVMSAIKEGDPFVEFYERSCQDILHWLNVKDEFVFLEIEDG